MNNRENIALIDKCIFSGVLIEDIEDMEKLVKQNLLEINTGKQKYLTKTMKEFSCLSLHDELIDRLKAGVYFKNLNTYGTLQTSIKDNELSNLHCYTVEEYKKFLEKIKKHLLGQYGITVDFSYLGLKQLEINRTFQLNGEFNDYRRDFKLLMAQIPKGSYLTNQAQFKDVSNNKGYVYGTFYAKSGKKQYLELKIYKKKRALLGFVVLSENWVRFELKLVGSAKVKRELETNQFYELTDEKINKWFNKKIKYFFLDPMEKWQQKRDKRLLKLMREQREKQLKNWITNTIGILQDKEIAQDFPELLDVEELLPIIDKLGLKAKRLYKVKNNFKKRVAQAHSTLNNRDDLKLKEVLDKLRVKEEIETNEADSSTDHAPLASHLNEHIEPLAENLGGMPKIA